MAFIVGTGTATANTGSGVLDTQTTAVGNIGAGEDTLHTYTMPANTLVVTKRGIQWEGTGSAANNANAKTLKVYFGSAILSIVLPAGLLSVASNWFGEGKIWRTGASGQRYAVRVDFTDSANVTTRFVAQGTLTETETSAVVIKATGTATSDNDLVQNTSRITFF